MINRDKYLRQLIDKQNNGLIKTIIPFRRPSESTTVTSVTGIHYIKKTVRGPLITYKK